MEVMKELAY